MAGKLKAAEMSSILQRLNSINSVLDSNVATLVRSQEQLRKAEETQKHFNKSLKPLFDAFVPQEDPVSSSAILK